MSCAAKNWSESAIAESYNSAKMAVRQHSKSLRLAVQIKDTVKVAEETNWFLTAYEPKVYFAIRLGRSPKLGPLSPGQCLQAASQLDLVSRCDEKAAVIIKGKLNGGHRLILDFGIRYRIAQNILRLVLSAHHGPKPFQYTHRGVPKAMKRVMELCDQGNVWFAHIDIKKFYPSFRIEKLRENAALGGLLSSKTLAAFVSARGLEVSVRSYELQKFPYLSYSNLLWEARRGIPTGSCLSSLIAPMMVSRLLLPAEVAAHLVNYEDDFFLLAKSKVELEKRIEAFESAVKGLPGGRFTLKQKSMGTLASSEVCFLGHCLYRSGAKTCARLTPANIDCLFDTLDTIGKPLPIGVTKKGQFEKTMVENCTLAFQYVNAWSKAFYMCEDVIKHAEDALMMIKVWLADVGKSFDDIDPQQFDPNFVLNHHFEIISSSGGIPHQ